MEQNSRLWFSYSQRLVISLFLLLIGLSASASTSISDDIFGDGASIGRNLLQTKTPCPSNYESLNYTILTSQCKGPQYPPNLCCSALLELACPYASELNDPTNDCSTILFSYITHSENYPPGLFSSECRDTKEGLTCPATSPAQSPNTSGTQIVCTPSPLAAVTTGGFLLLLLSFF